MTRDLTAAVHTELASSSIIPLVVVELDFSSGFVRVFNGVGSVTVDGDVYSGIGELGGIEKISETTAIQANNLKLSLNGIDPTLLSKAIDEEYQGRSATVKVVLLDDDYQQIADSFVMFGGFMDNMIFTDAKDTAAITVNCENWLRTLDRSNNRRYTSEDQQERFTGDVGCEFVAGLQDQELLWGAPNPKTPTDKKRGRGSR